MRLSILLPLCLSGAVAAQTLPLHGFDHAPLGQAQLSEANGSLLVSNIGSSGLDGVRTELDGSDFYTVAFMSQDAPKAPPGAFMKMTTRGNLAGANQDIWALSVENTGTSFGVSMSLGQIGGQSARVLAWNGEVQVADAQIALPSGPIIIVEVPPFGCRVDPVWPMGPVGPLPPLFESWAMFDLEGVGDVVINDPIFDAPMTVQADRVAIAITHSVGIGPLSAALMEAANVADFLILEETLGWKHHEHLQLGKSKFDISNGFLTIANIGSSGEDGVMIELDELMGPTTDNGLRVPLVPAVPLGPGRSMELQAFGSVQGNDSPLGVAALKRAVGGPVEVWADFSSLGGTLVHVVALLDGQVVADSVVAQGQVGTLSGAVVLNSCGKLPPDFEPFPPIGPIIIGPPQAPCYLWEFGNDTDLDISNGIDGGPVTIDELRLLAVDVPPVDGLSRFGISGTDLGSFTLADEIPLHGNAFDDLGCADPGTFGDPVLGAHGTLTPGSINTLGVSNGFQSTPALMFFSLSAGAVPFKGGTLKAFPILGSVPLSTDATGSIILPFPWPTGLPAGLTPTFQVAILDPGASKNVALTNAVQGTSH